jgi:hypothetical protein
LDWPVVVGSSPSRARLVYKHGDHDVGSLDLVGSQAFGELEGYVQADLGHGPDVLAAVVMGERACDRLAIWCYA